MTMQAVFFKENEGAGHNPNITHFNLFNLLELSAAGKDVHGKSNITHFNLFSGDQCKSGENGKTPLLPASTVDYRGNLELGFGQSIISGKYTYPDHCYGVYSSYAPQFAASIPGRMMLPLSLSNDGGPIFVNAKQYNGIMRRRKKRAEAELHNNLIKIRKPYLHLSRHLHAKRRPRGNGGRFLNTKSLTAEESQSKKNGSEISSPTGSDVSSDSAHDMFPSSRGKPNATALHLFQLNHLHHHSFHHPFPEATGIGIPVAPGNYLKV